MSFLGALFGQTRRFDPTNPEAAGIGRDILGLPDQRRLVGESIYAKSLKALKTGNFADTFFGQQLIAERERARRQLERKLSLSLASTVGEQPGLQANLIKSASRQTEDMYDPVGAALQLLREGTQIQQQGQQFRADYALRKRLGAASVFQPIQQYKTGGLFGALGSIAGAIAPVIPGLGAVGAGVKAVSSLASPPAISAGNSGYMAPAGVPGAAPGYGSGLNVTTLAPPPVPSMQSRISSGLDRYGRLV